MSKDLRRTWTDLEKTKLWLGYLCRLPVKKLADHLEKTTTSVNKVLDRSGIRDSVRSYFDSSDPTVAQSPVLRCFGQFEQLCQQLGLTEDNLVHCSYHKHAHVVIDSGSLQENGIFHRPPFSITGCTPERQYKSFQKLQAIENRPSMPVDNQWVSMVDVTDFLIREGQDVHILHCKRHRPKAADWLAKVNGQLMAPTQVLIQANRIRTRQLKAPFFVEGVTRE
ncbi:MAG: hypothetical protein ACPGXY_05465 [Alphaproteobacteria bacterium]